MNIQSASSFSSSFSVGQASRSHQRPNQQDVLASALQTVGVDDSTAADVLSQVKQAVDSVKSGASANNDHHSAVQSAIQGVLEANGIDPAKVGDAIQASRAAGGPRGAGGPQGGGRPSGPPPRSGSASDDEIGSIESALLSANVDEADLDELLTQLIETISELNANDTSEVSSDAIRTALTEVLEANDVDVALFEQAMQDELGASGSFFNRVA
ncbi:hypothetical protein Pla52o_27930 [Novipirellula galeiformis]|uniref:Uncharacterized protein n=1 Tax=Novipirellula galeiformis TaxID=2528004 RepID=A0A5C6CHN8_9BACT|nr:hypothetical protein [Novipirellula galeiformis]TWU23257.1 hypothetical protein Pla52o_27930 [Novipirellula galeiformis]